MGLAPLVLLSPLWFAACAPADSTPARSPGSEAREKPWRSVHDRLRDRCEEMASNLSSGRELLLERAAGNDELIERLTSEPIRMRDPGYGVLPQISENASRSSVKPEQKFFSIESLTSGFASEFQDAELLVANAADRGTALDGLVAEHERIRARLRNLESHLGYHRHWQRAVLEYPLFFAERNEIIVQFRALESRRREGDDEAQIATTRGELVDRLTPFKPTKGLALTQRDDGWRVLPVSVTTDIDDERFLTVFREGVEAEFADAAEVRALRFRIDLTFRRIPAAELYPEGPPAVGDPIDVESHRARFPRGALVMTTGGESTHAWTGRWIVLGPEEVSRRTLAHEFAHLLGFDDAYLRGFDGDPDGPFGVVLVEWTGLRDDLMGNVGGGRVTREMVETLVKAYGSPRSHRSKKSFLSGG